MIKTSTKLLTPALALLLVSGGAQAQAVQSGKASAMPSYFGELSSNVGNGYGQYRSVAPDALEAEAPTVIGNVYLTDNWASGQLYITLNRLLETDSFKYDIENNQFLINTEKTATPTPDQLRVINSSTVNAFKVKDPAKGERLFVNATNAGLTIQGQPAMGFVEVLVSDTGMSLFRKIDTETIHASYNVALAAGSKQDRIVKKEAYYVQKGDQMELFEITRKKKHNLPHFSNNRAAVEEYIKSEKINFKEAPDLVKLVTFYNTL